MRRMLGFTIFVLSLGLAGTASAGTCPSGANYLNPSNPAGSLVTLASLGVTTCYYIAANGSDSNDGAGEASGHPWAHAPGMGGCSGNCASNTPSSGTGYIFRGGDVWHLGNSSLSPYVGTCSSGICWSWRWGGSSSNPIYIGTDHGWYSGSSYARPIFNGDDTITTNTVASCTYDYFGDLVLNFNVSAGADYIIYDDFEWTGLCYNGQSGAMGSIITWGGTHVTAERLYFHGVTTEPGSSWPLYAFGQSGPGIGFGTAGDRCLFNVIDNSDGTWGNYGSYPNGADSLGGVYNQCVGTFAYNVVHRVSDVFKGAVASAHDNLFYDDYDPDLAPGFNQSGQHGDLMFSNNNGGNVQPPISFYNNVIYNVREGVGVWLQPTSSPTPLAYFFNNVMWNCYQQCYYLSSNPGAVLFFYNNTGDSTATMIVNSSSSNLAWSGTVHFSNGHYIGFSPAQLSSTYSCSGGASGTSCTWLDDDPSSEIFQTTATAITQGYTTSNNYAPTSSSGATVREGANYTSLCSTFSSDSALCYGTSGGVSEQAGEGGMVAVWPAITPVARPATGAWDSGAYQYSAGSSSNQPSAPTGLTASVQ